VSDFLHILPPPHPSGFTSEEIEEWEAKFAGWQTTVNLCCFPTGILFLVSTYFLLLYTSHAIAASDGLSGFHLSSPRIAWWFFPVFGSISLCFEIVLRVWSVFLGSKVIDLYAEWDSRQPKRSRGGGIVYYDSRHVLRWTSLLITLPIGILSLLALPMHTTFAEDGLHVYNYGFSAPTVHPYADMRRVTMILGAYDKHGKFAAHPFCVIDFANRYRWDQNDWDHPSRELTEQTRAAIQAHTQLNFGTILVLEDLPPLSPDPR
jgi:hypothetical protein